MTTVASRLFMSTPGRDAMATWIAIVDLLTQGTDGPKRTELMAVAGVAASVIADHAPKDAAIISTCSGPRTRIYCIYDDDAIEGSDANEEPLGFDPLEGDWRVSLPCLTDDLSWIQTALKKHSTRITARGPDDDIAKAEATQSAQTAALVFDRKGFLGS
ncbi:hypothetical protein RA307_15090 [Xanthobacteraceae bacterium Astr-EGSB]|uniref:hypothetical protein n=1 Tax=Astrobacterium formosum TaxID=3069710 RepID=UPI0027B44C86|nr:hypothetical protein [Xanthobacteraceae bacterium Astr-EGSB]